MSDVDDRIATLEQDYLVRLTAVTEVLRVVSRSTFDLQAVLEAAAETAGRLCRSDATHVYLESDDGTYRVVAAWDSVPAQVAFEREHPHRPGRDTVVGRVLLSGGPAQVSDVLDDPEYVWPSANKLGGIRTLLGVPILQEGRVIGVFGLGRRTGRCRSRRRRSHSSRRSPAGRDRDRERPAP